MHIMYFCLANAKKMYVLSCDFSHNHFRYGNSSLSLHLSLSCPLHIHHCPHLQILFYLYQIRLIQIIPDSEFEAVVVEVEPSDRESKSIKDIIPRYVIIPGPR